MKHLDQIHIRNFRLFDSLDIEHIGKVNLITGKNNCGKTTLLEALNILDLNSYDNYYAGTSAVELLLNRGDWDNNDPKRSLTRLFNHSNSHNQISINECKISIDSKNPLSLFINEKDISIHFGQNQVLKNALFIRANFELDGSVLYNWSAIRLTEKEERVVEVLRLIEPRIERVDLDTALKTAFVRIKDIKTPVPLKNFGEGMNRLLTIALGLVNAENSLLLIDEIDLGLHHSVQTKLWEIVFSTAKRLNVQVFATTHSKDCVEAFQKVAASKAEFETMANYIRLQKNQDSAGFRAVHYDLETLETAVDYEIETR